MQEPEDFNLDTELATFIDTESRKRLVWTTREAVEGIQIFGGIGSGKTSGSGRMFAIKYLAFGFGGLVLTVKQDEKALWEEYCRIADRTDDLIIVEPGSGHYFNFLEYESTVKGADHSFTENIVQLLKTVISASQAKATGKDDDQFWETAMDLLLFNIIELCQLAYGHVTIPMLYDIAQTLPKKGADRNDGADKGNAKEVTAFDKAYILAREAIDERINEYRVTLLAAGLKDMTQELFEQKIMEQIPEARKLRYIAQFFSETFKVLNEKTRSILDFIFTGFLFRLLQDPVYSLFCYNKTNFVPEDCYHSGKIILVNLPVKLYDKVGRDIQIMFKYIWQRAMERRNVVQHQRPVFLWADEAQNFLHEYDADYQATARSSRIATVYISQNLPNYYANMGGRVGEFKVKSFLGTLGTKIFHANADYETNVYASNLIGEAFQPDESETNSSTDGKVTSSKTISAKLMKMARPEEFSVLMTGGQENGYKVQGYIVLQSKTFPSGFNFKKTTFTQKYPSV